MRVAKGMSHFTRSKLNIELITFSPAIIVPQTHSFKSLSTFKILLTHLDVQDGVETELVP
jgi:hypothetical protein